MKVVYGIDAKEEGDEYIGTLDAALTAATEGIVSGKFLVEYFPFLKHIPTWVPWAYSQRLFAKWQADNAKAQEVPHMYTLEHLVGDASYHGVEQQRIYRRRQDSHNVQASMAGSLLMTLDSSADSSQEVVIKNVCAVAFQGTCFFT